jgi:hypothetical protein
MTSRINVAERFIGLPFAEQANASVTDGARRRERTIRKRRGARPELRILGVCGRFPNVYHCPGREMAALR